MVAAIALAAFAVTISILGVRAAAGMRREAEALRRQAASQPALSAPELALTIDDFLLPRPAAEPAAGWVPWRPQTPAWTPPMVSRWWVPPSRVAADAREAATDREMRGLFEGVP